MIELYVIINKATRRLEFLLILSIILLYGVGIGVSFIDKSIVSGYFIVTSFLYYVILLKKDPGQPLDGSSASIRGICVLCNKVRGNKTRHCHICDMCYSRRDHHCSLIGKCITYNNFKELYFCLLFLCLFSLSLFIRKGSKGLSAAACLTITSFLLWMTLCVAMDKTGKEVADMRDLRMDRMAWKRIAEFVCRDITGSVCPLFKLREKEYA